MSEATSTLPLGSIWEIKTKDNVLVTRPDGTTATVVAFDGLALYALDVAGDYSADVAGKAVTVKAG